MSSPQLQTALWVSQPIALAAVAAVMYRLRQNKEFPIFFVFTLVQIAIFLVEFPVYQLAAYHAYFFTFWGAAALNVKAGLYGSVFFPG